LLLKLVNDSMQALFINGFKCGWFGHFVGFFHGGFYELQNGGVRLL